MKSRDDLSRLSVSAVIVIAAFALPALALLVIGLTAAERERAAIRALALSNLVLSGEKLASTFESRISGLARACLLDPETAHVTASLLAADEIASDSRIRGRLDAIRTRHPIARHLAVFTPDGLRYPRLHSPVVASASASPCRGRAAAVLESAASGRADEARQMSERLEKVCPDDIDEYGRPYALIAASAARRFDRSLLRELSNGRWDLSADYADYVLSKYGYDLSSAEPGSDYLNRLRFAEAVAQGFQPSTSLAPGHIARQSLGSDQLFFTSLGSGNTLVMAIDVSWAAAHLLPQCAQDAGAGPVRLQPASDKAGVNPRVAFPSLLPSWELALTPPAVSDTRYRLIVFTMSGFAFSTLTGATMWLLRNVRRQKRLNDLRATYVSGITHDLKTPLATIRLYADMLADERGITAGQHDHYSRVIAGESDRVSRSIDNALEFTKIERGERRYLFKPSDLTVLLEEVRDTYSGYWTAQGFQVIFELASNLPPLPLDREAIRQAVLNLIDNAIKFSADSRTVFLRLREAPGSAIVEVEDRGSGIAPEHRDKIFQRFYRAPSAAHQGGYGIGLYIVWRTMQAHGGCVDVQSGNGSGSCFRLIFPLCTAS